VRLSPRRWMRCSSLNARRPDLGLIGGHVIVRRGRHVTNIRGTARRNPRILSLVGYLDRTLTIGSYHSRHASSRSRGRGGCVVKLFGVIVLPGAYAEAPVAQREAPPRRTKFSRRHRQRKGLVKSLLRLRMPGNLDWNAEHSPGTASPEQIH